MQSPVPFLPFVVSIILADVPPGPNSFDPWALLERWGIAFVMAVIAFILWKRSEVTRAEISIAEIDISRKNNFSGGTIWGVVKSVDK